ncbi:tetratricopeptide repeat protein [Streptomyces misionensis]|uniref:tetratricopeptide repeat protein n=1 Tax=Streptomyces misionensis TaxID=67331 RepID=UPI003819D027
MEFDRRVQVRARRPGAETRVFGSGYLIAPRLVLTAAHVLADAPSDAVTVARPDVSGQEFPAVVLWRRRDETVDAALVEIAESGDWQTPESLTNPLLRQRFGRLIGTRPWPVTLTGFPRMQKDPEGGERWDEQLTGHIAPGTGALAGRYEISSTEPTVPVRPRTNDSGRWSGISGAAVLSDGALAGDDLLCGLVRRDRRADGGTRLTATTAAHLLLDKKFRATVHDRTGWEPVLEPVETVGLFAPAAPVRVLDSPTALLRADAEAVTFRGRDAELADLTSWCTDGPAAAQVRVLTGPGGQGKSRLARRLADDLRLRGWVTGHLRSDLTDHDAAPDLTPLTTALPLLIVVDYAETRPRLVRRIVTHLHGSRHRVRVLLLARSDGEWRSDPMTALPAVRRLLAGAPVTELGPLVPGGWGTTDERRTAFEEAARDLALLLPCVSSLPGHDWAGPAAGLHPPDDLAHARYDSVLTLQMTALGGLLQRGPRPAHVPSDAPAERILLEHEGRFWESAADAPAFRLGLPTGTLGTVVAVAALTGARSADEAAQVLHTIPDLPADRIPGTARWVAGLYPAEPDRYWGSLQPDRVAEFHSAAVLVSGRIRLPDLLRAAGSAQQARILTVLSRAVTAHYNAGRARDGAQLTSVMESALTGAALDVHAVEEVSKSLPVPSGSPSQLSSVALQLVEGLVEEVRRRAALDPASAEPALANLLSHLAIRLTETGRPQEALHAECQAVEIRRRLAASDRSLYEPQLAISLANLGNHLANADRHDEALEATEEAVRKFRRITGDIWAYAPQPGAYQPHLAAALMDLGGRLHALGRTGEALPHTEAAARIWERLAAEYPARYEDRLAACLENLAMSLTAESRQWEAHAVVRRSLEIRRRLAVRDPAAHDLALARSLALLAQPLEGDRPEEALPVLREMVEVRRRLSDADPGTGRPELARTRYRAGVVARRVEQTDEALAHTGAAVDTYRELAAEEPQEYEPLLALALAELGGLLSAAGRHVDALAAQEQALEISRRLAAGGTVELRVWLAHQLLKFADLLAEAGYEDRLFEPLEEAVELFFETAETDLDTRGRSLVAALQTLAARRWAAGHHERAAEAELNAVQVFGRLLNADPVATDADEIGEPLVPLCRRLGEAGRPDLAVEVGLTASAIWRDWYPVELAVARERSLAALLSGLAAELATAERGEAAALVMGGAVELLDRLVGDDPDYLPSLAGTLLGYALLLASLGYLRQALKAVDSAVECFHRLPETSPARLRGLPEALRLRDDLSDDLGATG